jgi:chromosome partitioning protein
MKSKKNTFTKVANLSGKGGTGKTSLTALMGDILSSRGYKVLVVDLNTQSDLTYGLGADILASGIGEYLTGEDDEPNFQEVKENFYVLNGGDGLNSSEFSQGSVSVDHYSHVLDEMKDYEFDIVITDVPPEQGIFERMGLYTADCANVIMSKHPFSQRNGTRILHDIVSKYEEMVEKLSKNRKPNLTPPSRVNITLNNVERISKTDRIVERLTSMLKSDSVLKKVSTCVIHKDAKIDKPLEGTEVKVLDDDGKVVLDDDGDVMFDNVYKPLNMFENNKGMKNLIQELNVLCDWVTKSSNRLYK